MALMQADPELLAQLQRMATAQTVMAVATVVLVLMALGALIAALLALRAAIAVLRSARGSVEEQLMPRLDPLLERATRMADDATDVTDSLRRRVHEITLTLEELNVALRQAGRSAERRAREFGAVLDVVQEEAESLLLDATATARGVRTTADRLSGFGARRTGRGDDEPHDEAQR
jgi:hypothetical protein